MMADADRVEPGQDAPLKWGEKVIILGGSVLATLAMVGITSVLPQIQAELARGPSDALLVKQLAGIVGLAMVIGAPLAGFLMNKVPVRHIIVTASLVYTAAGTAGLYLSSLPLLLGSRLLVGIAGAAIQIIPMTLINTRLSGNDRARWMGAHISVAMFSTILLHPLAGFLGEFGWRFPFALYALGLLVLLFALLGMRTEKIVSAPARAIESRSAWAWFPFRYLALALAIGSIAFLPMVYAPFLIRSVGVTSPTTISLVLTADSLIGAVMALLYGRARRQLSPAGAFAFAFGCSFVGTLIAALASTFTGILIGMIVFGFGIGWMVPNLMNSLSLQVKQEQQARAAGVVKAFHYLAAPLCVLLIEPFARKWGPQSSMAAVSTVAFVMLLIMTVQLLGAARAMRRRLPA